MKDLPCPVRGGWLDLRLPDLSLPFPTPNPQAELTHPRAPYSSWELVLFCEFTLLGAILRGGRWERQFKTKKKKKKELELYKEYRACSGSQAYQRFGGESEGKKSKKLWRARTLEA